MLTAATVEIYFDLAATGGDYFTVEHPTKGVVQTGGYPIFGPTAVDVSAYVRSVTVTRGRDRQFDTMQAGTATVVLNNRTRIFDPLNTAGTYYGNIKPGKQVRISRDGEPFYVGKVADWNFSYDPSGISTATITCIDALGDLGAIAMTGWTTTVSQTSGVRVAAVLDRAEVSYPANRAIDAGESTLQADAVDDGTNVLRYLQTVEVTEQGRLYASRAGVLTFLGRTAGANASAVAFADTSAGLPFQSVQVSYGSELLFNQTITSRVGGSTEAFTDTGSVAAYGAHTLTNADLLFEDDLQTYDLGLFLLGLYAEPELRFSSISTALHRLTTAQRQTVTALDIGSVIQITYTPNGTGSSIVREAVIEGISHDVTRAEHTVTFSLGDTTNRYLFTVEDPIYGVVEGPGVVAF